MQTMNGSENKEEKCIPFAALFSVPVEAVEGPEDSRIHCGDDDDGGGSVTSIAPGQD